MIINKTSVYCKQCAVSHEAAIERQGNVIVGLVDCPCAGQRVVLSNNADLFLMIRSKSGIPNSNGDSCRRVSLQNYISVTNSCNYKCPVCFADAGNSQTFFMPPEEAYELGLKLKMAGGKNIWLLGGEPTVHPQLPEILKKLRKLNLAITLSSNGQIIADDVKYAAALKKSGLSKINLQFDTFDENTHLKLRGNAHIRKKIQAARNTIDAGLELGICTTVTDLNLHEVPQIVEYWLAFAPALNSIAFQVVTCTGRYGLSAKTTVCREQIILELLNLKTTPAVTVEDFWPLPVFSPWNFKVHPDCAANLYLAVKGGVAKPLGAMADIGAIQFRLRQNSMRGNLFSQQIIPLYYVLKEARPRFRREVLSVLAGSLFRKGKKGIVVIGAGSFLCEEFQDEERLSCCPTSVVTREGFVSPCIYYR